MSVPAPQQPARYRSKVSAAAVVARHAEAGGKPYSAMLEIADRCNEACVHCYQVQGQKGELPTEVWERTLSELAELGVMFVTFSGGEPTLRRDFLHLVAFARKLRFAVKIYSNALNITAEMAAELGRLGVQEVQISLYSHEPELHEQVTRVPGSFERVVSATRDLRRAGVHVLLKTPMLGVNAAGVQKYADFAASLGADYAFDPKLSPREDGDLSPMALGIDRDAHVALLREPRLRPTLGHGPRVRRDHVCGACRGNVHVEANGELRPCTQWAVPTGQIGDASLASAWHDNPIAKTIRELDWEALPGCRGCELREYCKRCFATAQREVGHALMPYPSACRAAQWNYQARHGVAPVIEASGSVASTPPAQELTGPFRHEGDHHFRVAEWALTDADRALVEQNPWLRGEVTSHSAATPGPLVQLRRGPGGGLTGRQLLPSTEG